MSAETKPEYALPMIV